MSDKREFNQFKKEQNVVVIDGVKVASKRNIEGITPEQLDEFYTVFSQRNGLSLSGVEIAATAFAGYGMIALSQSQVYLGRYCFTVVGALFGFLWFNVHPAELIMGDTGSMALGSTLAVVALMSSQWAVLPMIAIIPLSEILSVVIQILYFRATKGKRFFKMAPLHLHFELLGWSETQVVQRFWLIGLLAAMVGVGLALV